MKVRSGGGSRVLVQRGRALAFVAVASLIVGIMPSYGSIPEDPALWATRSGGGDDRAISVLASPDGSKVFVTGASWATAYDPWFRQRRPVIDYLTEAYSTTTGARLWSRRYDGPGILAGDYSDWDSPKSMTISPDGSTIYVTGESDGGRCCGNTTGHDYATVAYSSSTGQQLWVARSSSWGDRPDYPYAVAASPDGSSIFVSGSIGTFAYSSSDGTQLWSSPSIGQHLSVSPDGSSLFLTATGFCICNGYPDYFSTVALSSANGSHKWTSNFYEPSAPHDGVRAIESSPDGSKVFVTGASSPGGFSGLSDYTTIAYSAVDGTQVWIARYSNGPSGFQDLPRSLAVSPEGSVLYVTGFSEGDFATVAYSATTGDELWVVRFDGGSYDEAMSVGVSPDGSSIFVTGESGDSRGAPRVPGTTTGPPTQSYQDYMTIAYDGLSGNRIWTARYDWSGGTDRPSKLAVGPDGSKVFVTGLAGGSFGTIAYRTTASCSNGSNENGSVSRVVHETLDHELGAGAGLVHGVNCEVAAEGL